MAAPESGIIAVLAEKPSVARDIARVLGATSRGDGYLHGNGWPSDVDAEVRKTNGCNIQISTGFMIPTVPSV
jgi:hypothetical protein